MGKTKNTVWLSRAISCKILTSFVESSMKRFPQYVDQPLCSIIRPLRNCRVLSAFFSRYQLYEVDVPVYPEALYLSRSFHHFDVLNAGQCDPSRLPWYGCHGVGFVNPGAGLGYVNGISTRKLRIASCRQCTRYLHALGTILPSAGP